MQEKKEGAGIMWNYRDPRRCSRVCRFASTHSVPGPCGSAPASRALAAVAEKKELRAPPRGQRGALPKAYRWGRGELPGTRPQVGRLQNDPEVSPGEHTKAASFLQFENYLEY